jgi:DNA repair exonuclease SbcCD nuclease subunit
VKYPYGIISDSHLHNWSAFSAVNADGVNSRLQSILDEIERAGGMIASLGGDTLYHAGDMFHVRGKIEPSVFNPTVACFEEVCREINVEAISGNHDLETRDSTKLGNAMQGLGQIRGFNAHTEPTWVGDVLMIPWVQDLDELRDLLRKEATLCGGHKPGLTERDVIIHAPVNGIIKGIPDHGLHAAELAAYGFRRVFAGHYHDHKVMEEGRVISIGATGHQTWSDPGTKAGFLIVWEDRIEHVESLCPKFVDLGQVMADPNDDLGMYVKGNYVRLKLDDVTEAEIKEWREELSEAEAAGVIVIATKKAATGRSGASTKAAISIDASVVHFIEHDQKPMLLAEVSELALEVLNEARS